MKVKKAVGNVDEVRLLAEGNVFIGIDQSFTGFGVTLLSADGERYLSRLYVPELKGTPRLDDVYRFVYSLIQVWDPVLEGIAIEGYAAAAKFGANLAGELGATIKLAAYHVSGDEPLVVAPTQVKKYATGKGSGGKDVVLLGVYKTWGVEFDDNNLADSYVIARIAAGLATNQAQRDVVAAVRKEQK